MYSHLMSLLIELAFSLAASVSDWTRCSIESLVLAGLVGALMVRLPGCCCCWNSSRMSAASDAGVAAWERDGLDAYCRCWARCCDCVPGAGGRSVGAIDGSASSASEDRSPEENLQTTDVTCTQLFRGFFSSRNRRVGLFEEPITFFYSFYEHAQRLRFMCRLPLIIYGRLWYCKHLQM